MVLVRIADIQDCIGDGIGMGLTVYFSGCSMGCCGCQNPELQSIEAGYDYDTDEIIRHLESHRAFYDSLILSGGDPVEQPEALLDLLLRSQVPTVLYTGRYWGQLNEDVIILADYIKCGPYIKSLKTEGFPASLNQQVYYHGKPVSKIGEI